MDLKVRAPLITGRQSIQSQRPRFAADPLPPLPVNASPEALVRAVEVANGANLTQRLVTLTTTGLITGGNIALEADNGRRFLACVNLDVAAFIMLGFGSEPSLTVGWPLSPGEKFVPPVAHRGTLYALASVSGTQLLIIYG